MDLVKEENMGPLTGVKIIEVGGIGPGPFCGMMLSDMGAEIVRIERKGGLSLSEPKYDLLTRNRKSISMNLRKPQGIEYATTDAGAGGCPAGRLSSRRHGEAGHRARCLPENETPGSFTAG